MRKVSIVLSLFAVLLYGCSTDFDMYGEYEDITIVYALADFGSDTTWVRITKAYTGPGNAMLIAQNPDSSNYPYKLDVTLNGRKNGIDLDPITLDTIVIHNKDLTQIYIDENGDTTIINPFYAPDQLMYYAVGNLDQEADYTLNIKKRDGELSASTGIVNNFYIVKPMNRIAFSTVTESQIEWISADNGKRYEVTLVFNYQEYVPNSPDYTDTLMKSVTWNLGYVESKTTDGGEDMEKSFSGTNFFNLLQSELEPIPNVERWAVDVDMILACGSPVLATYLDINTGSESLLEEVPVYSNVDGGTGIFASRHTIVKPIELSVTTELDLVEDYDLGFKLK